MINPDVAVERQPGPSASPPGATTTATVRTPVTLPLLVLEEPRETYIEILHRPDRSLIAVLELLSPANMEEPGRGAYLAKRNAVLRQSVHLVELDLLLGGRRLTLREALPAADYYAFVARADRRPECEVYHWNVADPLPGLPIPLRPPNADVIVDLAAVFAVVYERGGYRREIDYAGPPRVPITEEQHRWIAEVVRSPG
jgi:hypothetical protein